MTSAGLHTSALLTEQFYDWELRGRGWNLWDYPVSLEPPFRPFFFHGHGPPALLLDDGRHETALSELTARIGRFFRKGPGLPISPETPSFGVCDAMEIPEAATESPLLAECVVLVPSQYVAKREVMDRLLVALASHRGPLAFEVLGTVDGVAVEFVCRADDRARVASQLSAYVPEVVIGDNAKPLSATWREHEGESLVVDFGLSNEFMLPLQAIVRFEVDPLIPGIAGLADLHRGELGILQVLFQPVRHPWAESIVRALSDGAGGSFFSDAPEMLSLAREKISSPLFAAVVRVAAKGRDEERAHDIARRIASTLLPLVRPGSNELVPLEGDGYSSDAHEDDLLSRRSHRSGMILSLAELRSLVHIPDASVRVERFRRLEKKTKGVPAEAMGNSLALGENIHRGRCARVSLSHEQRLKHIHVIGASGTGKSTLLVSMVLQAIAAGEGVAVLDPHGDLVDEILGRLPEEHTADIVVFDPSDPEYSVGFNVLRASSEVEKEILASDLVAVFRRLATSWGDQMTAVLGNAISAFLEHPEGGTLSELRNFLADSHYRRAFLASVYDPEVRRFWEQTFPLLSGAPQASILTRLNSFLRPRSLRNVVSQKNSPVDLSSVVSEGNVFLAKLSQGLMGAENAHFLGSLLVTKFHQVALARQALSPADRRPFFLVVDEFQDFATPSMAAVLSGARKFGMGLVLAHQELGQLASTPEVRSALLGNAYTRVVFRVGDEDARALSGGFSLFDAGDLASLDTGEAICRVGQSKHDFSLRTLPLPHVSAEIAAARRGQVIDVSRAKYGQQRGELDELGADHAVVNREEAPAPRPAVEARVASLAERPTPVRKAAEPAVPGRGGKEHKYLQHLVMQLAEQRGFRVALEEELSDRSGRIDVLLQRDQTAIACEISVTSTPDQEVENVRKCLGAGFQQVLVIAADQRRLERLKSAIEKEVSPDGLARVAFAVPEAIVEYLDAQVMPSTELVRGYSVRVTRKTIASNEAEARREAIGLVIARSISKRG